MQPGLRKTMLVAGWLLLYSRQGHDWAVMGEYPQPQHCAAAMSGAVDSEAQSEMGGALAGQPADNPLRQDAYRKAARRVQDRFRCEQNTNS